MKPCFFPTAEHFREWLKRNHDKEDVLLVGFYKRDSGRPSMTWSESVDQALCFGWIDGVRKRIDDDSYTIRFSRRRPRSIWSAINIAKAKELIKNGLVHPAGLAAWAKRDEKKSAIYAYERETKTFSAEEEKRFHANKSAWKYFSERPPGYRKQMTYYVVSAKKEETRAKRLKRLIDASAKKKKLY
jgi:uncharacterized protein YdeI (YjbR/CyaY-like superfamily)